VRVVHLAQRGGGGSEIASEQSEKKDYDPSRRSDIAIVSQQRREVEREGEAARRDLREQYSHGGGPEASQSGKSRWRGILWPS